MGGPSFKTEKDHKEVWDHYVRLLAEYGDDAKYIKRSVFHQKIADLTCYSEISVRTIINNHEKPNTITRILNKERILNLKRKIEVDACLLSKKTADVTCC